MNNIKLMKWTFITLYILVSFVSINHLFYFLSIVDSDNMAIILSAGYALGTAASIYSLSIANKIKQNLIIGLFVLLTIMEVLGNVYFAFSNLDISKVTKFSELFGITDYSDITQKRLFSLLFGIPIVLISMGYIKVLINYLNSNKNEEITPVIKESFEDNKKRLMEDTKVLTKSLNDTPKQKFATSTNKKQKEPEPEIDELYDILDDKNIYTGTANLMKDLENEDIEVNTPKQNTTYINSGNRQNRGGDDIVK